MVGFFSPEGYLFGTSGGHLEAVLENARDVDMFMPFRSDFALPLDGIGGLFVLTDSEQTLASLRSELVGQVAAVMDRYGFRLLDEAPFSLFSMRDMEKAYLTRSQEPLAVSAWFAVLVLCLTIFGYGSMNALNINDRRPEFGVHFACGASRKSLVAMVLLETTYPLVLPLILIITVLGAAQLVDIPLGFSVNGSTIGTALTILLAITVVCGAAPMLLIGSTSPVELLTEKGKG